MIRSKKKISDSKWLVTDGNKYNNELILNANGLWEIWPEDKGVDWGRVTDIDEALRLISLWDQSEENNNNN